MSPSVAQADMQVLGGGAARYDGIDGTLLANEDRILQYAQQQDALVGAIVVLSR